MNDRHGEEIEEAYEDDPSNYRHHYINGYPKERETKEKGKKR